MDGDSSLLSPTVQIDRPHSSLHAKSTQPTRLRVNWRSGFIQTFLKRTWIPFLSHASRFRRVFRTVRSRNGFPMEVIIGRSHLGRLDGLACGSIRDFTQAPANYAQRL